MLFAALAGTFQYFWFLWFMLFVLFEGLALWLSRNQKGQGAYEGGTLSELVWRLTKNKAVFAVFTGLWLVLGFHFFIDR